MEEKKSVNRDMKSVGLIIGGIVGLISISLFSGFAGASIYERWNTVKLPISDQQLTAYDIESVTGDIVNSASDSVVSIAINRVGYEPGEGLVAQSTNIGTGFIVSENGLIITNQHVVDTDGEYKVVTSYGDEYDVEEIIRDNTNDIALLLIDAENLKPLKLGDSENLRVGSTVIAIGTPLGNFAGSVTKGIISGTNRSVSTGTTDWGAVKEFEGVIQTDAAVNPGNSGGPLINIDGEVIGVNFATTAGADNISFALPINRVKSRLDEYRKYGKFLRPYLGVEYQMVSESVAYYYENLVSGALIIRVVPDSPASDAGLIKGDVITEMGGEKIKSSLVSSIQKWGIDEEVEIKVYRDGQEVPLTVTFAEAD